MLWMIAKFGSQSGGKFTDSLQLLCVPKPASVISLLCILDSGSYLRPCLASEEPLDVLVQEGENPIGVATLLFQRIMNHIFLRESMFW